MLSLAKIRASFPEIWIERDEINDLDLLDQFKDEWKQHLLKDDDETTERTSQNS